jgi:filamentous hemagglutinin family protein
MSSALFFKKILVFLGAILLINSTYANPEGGVVSGGSATISSPDSTTTLIQQNSDKAVIDWHSFNIQAGETTRFQQPSASSIALNRIDPRQGASQIFGTLSANGNIILINQAGVFFGNGSMVNVGSIIASTANMSNENFLAGHYIFDQPSLLNGSIINQGTIQALSHGLVALIGSAVSNQGVIQAELGNVVLASGSTFTVNLGNDGGLLNFKINQPARTSAVDSQGNKIPAINNSGSILADGGTILLTAQAAENVLDNAINMSGIVEAHSVAEKNGVIQLLGDANTDVNVSGNINASGNDSTENGGIVNIIGRNIQLTDSAVVNASGQAGGGTILVGGDYQGSGNLLHANSVYIQSGAKLLADAIGMGDGGKIIAWSDGLTRAYGEFSVQGGASGGNGGLVETSGHILDVEGARVNAIASNGKYGDWLLDPTDLTISASATSNVTTSGNTYTGDANQTSSNLLASALTTALASANITVKTTSGGTGSGAGNITVNAPLSWSAATSLTLSSYKNIVLTSSNTISNSNSGGSLNLIANNEGAFAVGSGSGIVTQPASTINMAGAVNVYYNPASSYTSPTSYTNTGAGAVTAYMLINNATDLQNMSTNLSGNYALSKNIDASATSSLNSGAGLVPIGTSGTPFTGKLNGQNYIVSNLYINRPTTDSVGLFGVISSPTISNIGLENVNVSGRNYVGGLIGNSALTPGGTLTNAWVSGQVTGTSGTDGYIGGLVGVNRLITISNSYNAATVTGISTSNIGGLVGGVASSVGVSSILNSYNIGTINAGTSTVVGGLVGLNTATVTNSYSSGSVTGLSSVGGLIGSNAGTVTASFWDTATSGQATSAAGTGLTTSQMMTASNFTGWSITDIGSSPSTTSTPPATLWLLIGSNTRPMLASEWNTTINTAHQLQLMQAALGASYTLNNNIDLSTAMNNTADVWGTNQGASSGSGFFPIGNGAASGFTGQFNGQSNGQNSVIKNLYINRSATNSVGLFGLVFGPTLSNIGLQDVTITGSNFVGGLVGNTSATSVSGTLTNSWVTGQVTGSGATGWVGGLVGVDRFTTISNSYSGATITGSSGARVGGLIGGTPDSGASISNSYSLGNVTGSSLVGGFIGAAVSGTSISNSYSTGIATGTTAGGFIGSNAGTITNSFWDTATSGKSAGFGSNTGTITNLTGGCFGSASCANGGSIDLTLQASYTGGWDFTSIWNIISGQSYAYLRNIYSSTPRVIAGSSPTANTTVTLAANGTTLTSTKTGNNGAFYFLQANNAIADSSPVLVYLSSSGGSAVALAPTSGGSLSVTNGLNIASNTVTLGTTTSSTLTSSLLQTAAGSLGLSNTLYSISGNNLTMNSGSSLSTTSNTNYSLAGATTFTTTSGGIMTLAGNIVGGGNGLTLSAAGNSTVSGVISGTGTTLTNSGAGTLTLSGTNTYTGATTINAGTLQLGASNALSSSTAVNVAVSGAVFDLNNFSETIASLTGASGTSVLLGTTDTLTTGDSSNTTYSGVISGTGGALTKQGSGTFTLAGTNTYTGLTTINAGTLSVTNASALGTTASGTTIASTGTLDINGVAIGAEAISLNSGTITGTGSSSLTGNITLGGNSTLGGTGALTLSGIISGSGLGITKTGAGTVTLSGANTYTGGTTINAGTLQLGASNVLSDSTAVNVAISGAVFDLNNFSDTIASLTGVSGTSVTLGSGTLTTGDSSNTTYSGVISGTGGALTKQGSGTFTLAGTNTYTGLTTISAGTLSATNASALGTTASGTTISSSGTLDINGVAIGAEAISLNGGTITGTGTGSLSGNITLGSSSTLGGTGALTLSGIISGSGLGITKTGAGTVTLSGNNTYTGSTTINAGTLKLGASNVLSDSTAVNVAISGAVFDLNNFSETIASLTGVSGTSVTLGTTDTLTTGDSSNTTYSGVISGAGGALTKQGSGTFTLSGANTYTGLTTVSAGILSANNATALGTIASGTTVNSGATLDINSAAIGAEAITLNGGTALTGTGTGSLAGTIALNTAPTATVFSANSGAVLTLNGAITGAFDLTLQGLGTINLGGGSTSLTSLTSSVGTLGINSSITTTGAQSYTTPVVIGGAGTNTLRSTANNITFGSSANITGSQALTLWSAVGGNTINGTVSSIPGLILTAQSGTTDVIGSTSIATTGSQVYNNALSLTNAGSVTLSATGSTSDITIGTSGLTWSGTNTVSLSAGRNLVLNGPISGTQGSLSLSAVSAATSATSVSLGSLGTINVKNFNLAQGGWQQIGGTWPAFNISNSFQINGGSMPSTSAQFIRVTGGDGVTTPYQITDIYGLQGIGSTPTTLGYKYQLQNNIDASVTSNWNSSTGFIPMGTSGTPFTGQFNGQNYTINALYMNNSLQDNGLFGAASGSGVTIQNGGLTNINITSLSNSTQDVGGWVGLGTNITLNNVYVTGLINRSASAGGGVGGLIGNSSNSTITNSYNAATMTGSTDASNGIFLGGLVGQGSASISSSHNTGSLSVSVSNGQGNTSVGGLVGLFSSGSIQSSYNTGAAAITGTSVFNYAGGLVGRSTSTSTISQSYNTGTVSGGEGGGIVGRNGGTSISQVYSLGSISGINAAGGIVGLQDGGDITDSYAAGSVSSPGRAGGLLGSRNSGTSSITNSYSTAYVSGSGSSGGLIGIGGSTGITVNSSYWNTETSGLAATGGGGTGYTTAQMMTQANFSGWDFSTTPIWGIIANTSYPYLKAFYPTTPRVISGTPVSSNINTTVNLAVNGAVVDTLSTAANNAFYFLEGTNAISGQSTLVPDSAAILIYSPTSTTLGNVVASAPTSSGSLTGLNSSNNQVLIKQGSGNSAVSNTVLINALGSLSDSTHILYSVSGNNITLNTGVSLSTATAYNLNGNMTASNGGNLSFAGLLSIGSSNLSLTTSGSGGDVIISGGIGSSSNNALTINTIGTNSSIGGGIDSTLGSLTLSGTGTVTLSGTNSYTGATTISAGTLKAGAANAFAANSDITLNSGAFLALNNNNNTISSLTGAGNVTLGSGTLTTGNSSNTTYSGVMSGTGGLTKQGSGIFTLSNSNTYTGATTINAGTLQLGASNVLSDSTAVNINSSGAVFDLNNFSDTIASLTGASGSSVALGSGTLTTGDSSNTTYSGVISGSGALTKQGSGTFTLSGSNTYTGATTINTGILQAGAANAFSASSAVTANSGTTLDLNNNSNTIASLSGAGNVTLGTGTLTTGNSSNTTYSGVMSGTGGLTKQGSGIFTLTGSNSYTGATTINAGTLKTGSVEVLSDSTAVNLAVSGAIFDMNNLIETIGSLAGVAGTSVTLLFGDLTTGDSSNTTYSGVISGSLGDLIKQGSGTFTLSGANTYTGLTAVNEGTLSVNNAAALGTIANGTIVASGATLDINNALITNLEPITLNGGTITGTGTSSLAGNITLGSSSTLGGTGALTLSGIISGSGLGITKTGSGTVTLSGNNTYTGSTTINAGTLKLGASNVLSDSTAVNINSSGAVFDLNNFSETIASLAGASGTSVTLGSGTLTTGDSSNTTYSGVISGTGGALTKQGSGTFTLAGANTYTGATTISAGTLKAGAANAFSSNSDVTVNSGAFLNLNNNSNIISSLTGAGNVTLGSGTLTTGNSSNTTYSGVMSGTGGLTKQGSGIFTLSNSNTYTGATTINAGTLKLAGTDVLSDSTAVNLALSGATFNLNNLNETIGSLAGVAGTSVTLLFGELTTGDSSNTTYSGVISGALGDLIKQGSGTFTLSGANTYGGTTINAGTLQLGASNALSSSAVVDVAVSGAVFNLNNFNNTIASLTGVSGTSVALGTGTLTTGDSSNTTYSGVISGTGERIKTKPRKIIKIQIAMFTIRQ